MAKRSLSRLVSIRSADDESYKDDHAGLLSPQDNNALSRMTNRTMEVDDKQWALLHLNSKHSEDLEAKAAELDIDKGMDIPTVAKGSQQTWFWRKGFPMLNPYSKIYGWWCAYVLLMDGTYTAFVVPIGVGFNTSSVQWDWVGIFDFIAGVTFLGELVLNWNVAFVATHNLRKRIVLKRRRIAKFYVYHSTFVFDLISTMVFIIQMVGYGLGTAGSSSGTIIQVIQILRALRLLRLMKLLQQLFVMSLTAPQTNVPLINRAMPVWMSYLAQLMYIVGLFINILACVWVFVALREKLNNTWINNYEYFVSAYSTTPDSETLTREEALSIPGPTVYLAAAYWSLTTVATIGFGDILPVTNAERAVMLLVQITGVLFFGILLGSITSLLQRASQEVKDAQMFREKMGSVQDWMSRVKLPRDLKQKIRAYYAEVWVRQHLVEHDLQLFEELPQHLRAQVAWRSNKPIFDKILTFQVVLFHKPFLHEMKSDSYLQELSEETQYMIAARAKPVKIAPGHEICSQGDSADSVWLLHEGEVIATYHYHEAEVEKAPAIVGYTALLAAAERQYSVRPCGYRALMPCMLWVLTMQDLQPIVDWQEDVADHLEKAARAHLAKRQSAYPHLWGLDNSSGGQHGSEASDDEGIDSDNDQVKHYSTDDDIDLNEDRTGDTLKPPNRSRKHLVIKELPAGDGPAKHEDEVGADSSEQEHVVVNMQFSNEQSLHERPEQGQQPPGSSEQPQQHVASDHAQPSGHVPLSHQQQAGMAEPQAPQSVYHRQQQSNTQAGSQHQQPHQQQQQQQQQHQQHQPQQQQQQHHHQQQHHQQQQQQQQQAVEDLEQVEMHDSADSQNRAQAAALQWSFRAASLVHGSRSGHQQEQAEAGEVSEPQSRQLGLGRHQQHQLYQQQREEQEQQQRHQEQQQKKQEQQQQQQQSEQQLADTSDPDASGTSRHRLLRMVSRGKQKLGTSKRGTGQVIIAASKPTQAATEPNEAPATEPDEALAPEPTQAPATEPDEALALEPNQTTALGSPQQVSGSSGVTGRHKTHNESVSQQAEHGQIQPARQAGSGAQPGLQIQQQLQGLTEAAEQIKMACLQLQRQLQ